MNKNIINITDKLQQQDNILTLNKAHLILQDILQQHTITEVDYNIAHTTLQYILEQKQQD